MTKRELRKTYKQQRAGLSEADRLKYSRKIATQCLQLPLWNYHYFHVFLPIEKQHEVDTRAIVSLLRKKGKYIAIPKSDFSTNRLSNYLLKEDTVIQKNSFGIPEPLSGELIADTLIEVVFIPLLAFDLKGYRVGYGGGFYDRFLMRCKKSTLKIGLSFFDAVPSIEDIHPYDIVLDYCVTPNRNYHFKDFSKTTVVE